MEQSKAGLKITDPETGSVVSLTARGVFTNAAGVQFKPPSEGIETNASIVGILYDRNSDNEGISAGVAGCVDPNAPGVSEAWGGFFNSLRVTGKTQLDEGVLVGSIGPKTRTISESYPCAYDDCIIVCYNNGGGFITVTLPKVGEQDEGRTMWIRRINADGGVLIDAGMNKNGGHNQLLGDSTAGQTYSIDTRKIAELVWDGQYWHVTQI